MESNTTLGQTVVTVPEFAQVENLPLVLTDYALDNGAGAHYCDRAGHQVQNYGECWLSSSYNGGLGADTCRWSYDASRRLERAPETNAVGVIACLENATAGNWGKALLADGTAVLTKDRKLSVYPHERVDEALKMALLGARQNNELTITGAFRRPQYCNPITDDQTPATMKCDTDICYAYRGEYYVNSKDVLTKRDDWYHCAPVRVLADTDTNRIQLQDMIINAPFDEKYHFANNVKAGKSTVADTALADFLNNEFLADLALSTLMTQNYKLTHTQDVFATGLKGQTAVRDAQLVR